MNWLKQLFSRRHRYDELSDAAWLPDFPGLPSGCGRAFSRSNGRTAPADSQHLACTA
jgi:hypothetical protein